MTDLEQRILTLLGTPDVDPVTRTARTDGPPRGPMKTVDIAKELLGPEATAKLVNPTLYSLEKQGRVVKTTSSDGKEPRWALVAAPTSLESTPPTASPTLPALPEEELKTRLVDLVRASTAPVPTLTLARAVYGPTATRKLVNPALYSLERKGVLRKVAEDNGTNPRWLLAAPATQPPTAQPVLPAQSVLPAPAQSILPAPAQPGVVQQPQLVTPLIPHIPAIGGLQLRVIKNS
jgi:hypothetical protein